MSENIRYSIHCVFIVRYSPNKHWHLDTILSVLTKVCTKYSNFSITTSHRQGHTLEMILFLVLYNLYP